MHYSNIFFEKYALKSHGITFKIVGVVKERIVRVGSGTFCKSSRIQIQNFKENEIRITKIVLY
jgi:hypothetical protein